MARTRLKTIALSCALSAAVLSPLATGAIPAMAQTQSADAAIKDALKQASTLNSQRKFQAELDLLMPLASSQDAGILNQIGVAYAGLRTPDNCKLAYDYYTKAIAIDGTVPAYYGNRAGADDCMGLGYLQNRLNDRQKVVDLAEAANGGTASAGQYSDLAGANAALVAPSGQGAVDFDRATKTIVYRSKAIALDKTPGRLMDRAENLKSWFNGAGTMKDAHAAWAMAQDLDMGVPANVYTKAEIDRRYGALGATYIAPGDPTQAQLRNEAVSLYSQYIQAFEESGKNFAKYPSGIDAHTNRGVVLRDRASGKGAPADYRDAISDFQAAFDLNPGEPRRQYDIADVYYNKLNQKLDAVPYLLRYMSMLDNGKYDLGNNSKVRAMIQAAAPNTVLPVMGMMAS